MRLKTNRIFAILLTVVMCFTSIAPIAVFAEDAATRKIIAQENFDDKTVNTNAGESAVLAAGGFWFGDNNGSQYTMENGTLLYTDRDEDDLTDIRFYYNTAEQEAARELLKDDFTLSFRVKPLMNSLDMWVNWAQRNDGNGNIASPVYEDGLRLSWGVLSGRGIYDRTKAEVPVNQWSVIEVYFEYDATATAYYTDKDGVQHETGEIGAFTSYSVRLNGMDMGTAAVGSNHPLKNAYHCIDMFRLFQGATGNYELDDLTILTGAAPYSTKWDQSQADYYANTKIFYDKPAVNASDYAYSLAIVGDTQVVCENDALYNQNGMDTLYQWIVDNAASKNIQYVLGVGDITQHQNNAAEFALAKEAISKMDGVVPYSLARGNHDNSDPYNNTFNTDLYKSQFDGFYNDKLENAYKLMTLGGTKYLFITLDYGPENAVLEWAGDLCETYSDHKVIITTHAYLYADGTTIDSNDSCDPITMNKRENNGETMWEKLGKKYENIFMIISGHECSDRVLVTEAEGENGNIVTQMLVDFQGVDASYGYGSAGMVTMLYFSKDGKSVTVETYSTILKKYFREDNQFSFAIDKKTVVSHDFDNVTLDTSNGYGSFGKVASYGGLGIPSGAPVSTATNRLVFTDMKSGVSFMDLQLYGCGYGDDGASPMNRDFVLAFDIMLGSATANYSAIQFRDNKEDVWKDAATINGGKIHITGANAALSTTEMTRVELVFNYDADATNTDSTKGAFTSITFIVGGKQIGTVAIDRASANFKFVNHFRMFRYWGAESTTLTIDNVYVGYGKGNRGAEHGTTLFDVDFTGMTTPPTHPSNHYNTGFKLMNGFIPANGGTSYVSNDILTAKGGSANGRGFIDWNLGDINQKVSGQDVTFSMLVRPIGDMSANFDIGAKGVNQAEISYNASTGVNTFKIKGASKGYELSNYRFTNIEFVIHYDYAKMAYTAVSLYANGEFVGSTTLAAVSEIKLIRMFDSWSWNSTRGFEIDRATIVTGAKITYKGETAVTEFIGYQTTAVKDGKFNLRLISVVTDEDLSKYDCVGYNVVASFQNGGETMTMTLPADLGRCNKVFTSVLATEDMAVASEITAETLGGEYIMALNCIGLPADCDVQFTVSTYYKPAGQNEVTERAFTFTVNSVANANQGGVN